MSQYGATYHVPVADWVSSGDHALIRIIDILKKNNRIPDLNNFQLTVRPGTYDDEIEIRLVSPAP